MFCRHFLINLIRRFSGLMHARDRTAKPLANSPLIELFSLLRISDISWSTLEHSCPCTFEDWINASLWILWLFHSSDLRHKHSWPRGSRRLHIHSVVFAVWCSRTLTIVSRWCQSWRSGSLRAQSPSLLTPTWPCSGTEVYKRGRRVAAPVSTTYRKASEPRVWQSLETVPSKEWSE